MRPSILVAEDDGQLRSALRCELERCGYDVCEAADGNEALAALEAVPFALVIADVTVPKRDGIEILDYVRKECPVTPVIIIGTPGDDLYLESARGLGAAYTLFKPVQFEELDSVVRGLLVEQQSNHST